MPIGDIKKAVVFVDNDADADFASKAVRKFFEGHGIPVMIICPEKWDINLFGWLKKQNLQKESKWDADILISLAGPENFAAEHLARCSRARFKVGRFDLKENVFDIVIANREHQLPRQPIAFETVVEYLLKVI